MLLKSLQMDSENNVASIAFCLHAKHFTLISKRIIHSFFFLKGPIYNKAYGPQILAEYLEKS